MHTALSAVALTTVSISPVMLKAIPASVWRAALGLSSLMKSGYYRWMSRGQLYREAVQGLYKEFLPGHPHMPLLTFETHLMIETNISVRDIATWYLKLVSWRGYLSILSGIA